MSNTNSSSMAGTVEAASTADLLKVSIITTTISVRASIRSNVAGEMGGGVSDAAWIWAAASDHIGSGWRSAAMASLLRSHIPIHDWQGWHSIKYSSPYRFSHQLLRALNVSCADLVPHRHPSRRLHPWTSEIDVVGFCGFPCMHTLQIPSNHASGATSLLAGVTAHYSRE